MAQQKGYEIKVTCRTSHIANQSDEANQRYVFAYTITLVNSGSVAARLVSRHWIIKDAENRVQEVRGLGVVGEQPLLEPQQMY